MGSEVIIQVGDEDWQVGVWSVFLAPVWPGLAWTCIIITFKVHYFIRSTAQRSASSSNSYSTILLFTTESRTTPSLMLYLSTFPLLALELLEASLI